VVVTFVDISDAKSLEAKMGEALSVLQGRVAEQDAELDAARQREGELRTARNLVEQRLTERTEELPAARADTSAGQEP